jgi:hypothetical protein
LLTGKFASGSLRIGVIVSGGNVELADFFTALASKKV